MLEAVDRLVGQRRRSQFLAEAAKEKLAREDAARRFAERVAAARAAGSLANRHIPEWETSESAYAWLRDLRRGRDERIDRKWRES